jgi:hypothetical protein
MFFGASGDSPSSDPPGPWVVPDGGTLLDVMPEPTQLPGWLTQYDIGVFVRDYAGHGDRAFTGGLNWYPNIERNWELLAPFHGRRIGVPALYVAGSRDMVVGSSAIRPARPVDGNKIPRGGSNWLLPGRMRLSAPTASDAAHQLIAGAEETFGKRTVESVDRAGECEPDSGLTGCFGDLVEVSVVMHQSQRVQFGRGSDEEINRAC